MMYIDGLGYIDENVYNINNSNKTVKASATSFDSLLATETANLKNSGKTTCSLDDIFKEASEKYNISIDLLKAIGYNESRFQADATSHAGAMGIMQLMPATAEALGVTDAYDPYQNIMGSAKLLRQLSDMYDGNQTLMIAAYNAGSGNVAKYGGIPPFNETQNYVAKVLASMQTGVDVPDTTVSVNSSDNNSARNAYSTSGYQASSDFLNSISNSGYGQYTSTNLDDIFSYSDYQLLMNYFDHMLDIIASIGDTDVDSDNSGDDSLNNLFRLGNSSIKYKRNTIDL